MSIFCHKHRWADAQNPCPACDQEILANLEAQTRHFPPITELGQGLLKGMKEAAAVKHDQEKIDLSLLSPIAILEIGKVMNFGKSKYASHNWRGGFAWSRLLAATLRHVFAYLGGEDKDPESGISHLAHASCCLMFLLEFEVTHKDKDDRWKHG